MRHLVFIVYLLSPGGQYGNDVIARGGSINFKYTYIVKSSMVSKPDIISSFCLTRVDQKYFVSVKGDMIQRYFVVI